MATLTLLVKKLFTQQGPWQNDFQTHQLIAVYLAFEAILPG